MHKYILDYVNQDNYTTVGVEIKELCKQLATSWELGPITTGSALDWCMAESAIKKVTQHPFDGFVDMHYLRLT